MRSTVSLQRGVRAPSRVGAPRIAVGLIGPLVAAADGLVVLLLALGVEAANLPGSTASALTLAGGCGLLAGVGHLAATGARGLYRLRTLAAPIDRSLRLAVAPVVTGLVLTLLLASVVDPAPAVIVAGPLLVAATLLATRIAAAQAVKGLLARNAIAGRRVVAIAEPLEASRLPARTLLLSFGEEEVARVLLGPSGTDDDRLREAMDLARQHRASAFSLLVDGRRAARLTSVRAVLETSPLPAFLRTGREGERDVRVLLKPAPLSPGAQAGKRSADIAIAGLALLVLLPLLLLVALAIRLDSRGPAIFAQRRRGYDGRPFVIYKFRSMHVAEDGARVPQARRDDDRVTRIGRLIRRSSIDELPQLLNVVGGSMSLVGPRPHAIAHDDQYGRVIADYRLRHRVKPGITGWAQVNGMRGETAQIADMEARVAHDLWYIRNWSPLLDLRILLRTCVTVLGHDAY